MSSTTEVQSTGNFQPPVAAAPGDDGFVKIKADAASTKDVGRVQALASRNAVDLRAVISSTLDSVARAVDFDRGRFTKEGVATCRNNWNDFNWVMCHTAHSYVWMGQRGVDWEHWHYELDTKGPGTVGYEVYWARSGVFSISGDGGYINWAYIGHAQKLEGNATLVFTS